MAFNGKTKFSKITSPSYKNIVFTDSDSEDIPDLKLPPVKGKKPKRRKDFPGRNNSENCNFWTVVKWIFAVVAFTGLIGLVTVSFWSVRRIGDLQQHLTELENSNKATPPLITLQSQLATLNTTIMGVKTGQGSLQEMLESVSVLQQKFTTLEKSIKDLQESVASTRDILDAPDKLKILSDTLASLGSDLKQANNTSLRMEARVAALEKQAAENDNKPDLSNSVDKQDLISHTTNVTAQFQSVLSSLDQQSTRITILENATQLRLAENPKMAPNSSWVVELVNTILQEKLSSLTAGGLNGGNISQAIDAVAGAMFVPIGEFLAFRSDIVNSFEKLNSTIEVLNDELDQVAGHLDNNTRTLTNLISTVIKMSAGQLFPAVPDSDLLSSTAPPNTTVQTSTSAATRREVHIEGINTLDELHTAFTKWPVMGGQINLSDLAALTGLNTEDLKPFDTDNTSSLNEDELAAALGLSHNPR